MVGGWNAHDLAKTSNRVHEIRNGDCMELAELYFRPERLSMP